MTIDEFWRLIDGARGESRGEQGAMVEALAARLKQLPAAEVTSFDGHFRSLVARAYRWDLWGAAYIMNGGCSDDGFEYFRRWLVAMGRDVYEGALRDPQSLADVALILLIDGQSADFEEIGGVAAEVHKEMTGEYPPDSGEGQEPNEPAGEAWEEDSDDLERRMPRLWKRFADR